jgi:hypothetical protein
VPHTGFDPLIASDAQPLANNLPPDEALGLIVRTTLKHLDEAHRIARAARP